MSIRMGAFDTDPGIRPTMRQFVAYAAVGEVVELPAHDESEFGFALKQGRMLVVAGGAPARSPGGALSTARGELSDPTGLAVDPEGDLLISDTGNCRIRMVAASNGTRYGVAVVRGDIYTVAGTGVCGSSGDGGPALDAQLWDPGTLAVNPSGDLYVADQGNRTIRVLASRSGTFFGIHLQEGELGTIAGEGSYGPYLTDGLPALGEVAELNFPLGIALDAAGDVFISDGDMHVIRMVPSADVELLGKTAQAGDMYTVAGALSTGEGDQQTRWVQTKMLEPDALATSRTGALIYCDSAANAVRELAPGT